MKDGYCLVQLVYFANNVVFSGLEDQMKYKLEKLSVDEAKLSKRLIMANQMYFTHHIPSNDNS